MGADGGRVTNNLGIDLMPPTARLLCTNPEDTARLMHQLDWLEWIAWGLLAFQVLGLVLQGAGWLFSRMEAETKP